MKTFELLNYTIKGVAKTTLEYYGLEPGVLSSLKMLVLSDLLRAKSAWINDSLKLPTLERITISVLCFNNENPINLRCAEGHQSWWSALVGKRCH
ncbi:hypothetical protein CFP56_039499 [Quercus suber]|uniref:Uncharacterized protein n=1 Tax=Quercus suber TaxID=58331 RepID=A0AAW0J0M2_QUESU